MRDRRRTALIVLAAVAALAAGGTAVAGAVGGDDDARERPIPAAELDRATQAALDHVGGGEVTGTEAGDEEGAYEVEVTRQDGSQVDVHLDEDFRVLGTEGEGDESGDDEGS